MIKTYISALLVVLLAGAQMVHAQESMEDVFTQMEAANVASSRPVSTASAGSAAPVAAESVGDAEVQQAPTAAESGTLSLLFKKGREQYKAGKYDEAIVMFDAMLAIDKYNNAAMTHRKRAANRIAFKEARKQGASRAQAIADIDAAWNPEPKVFGAIDVSEAAAADPDQQAIQQMEARLKAITVPSLDFTDARIEDVVLFLADASRRGHRANEDVDLLLVGMESATGDSNVTISIADMSLYEALQFIVEMASLKFEVKPNVVAIMPANYVPASEMITKSYDIVPEVGADLESAGDSGGGAEDLFGDASSSDAATGPVEVSGFFSIVDFPKGASATYQPRFHKLFVKNTLKNLKAVETILADLDEKAADNRSQQVEIEAKFVEFSEGAFEELGFDWTVYGDGSVAGMEIKDGNYFQKTTGYTTYDSVAPADDLNSRGDISSGNDIYFDPVTGQQLIEGDKPGQNLFGSGQRNNTSAFESIRSGLLSAMGGTPAAMVFSNGDIDLSITAMEQEGTADVLSAPRVVTKSGTEALIRVAETHRYPQDYDVETGQRTAPVVKPQDWEDFDLGVSLKVTPVVDSESNSIDLELHPEIIKFMYYDDYIVGFNAFDAGTTQRVEPSGDGEPLLAKMASFERRSIQTQVTIGDGQTVVMGGLVDERTETFRDQVPFLGDIPYIGRLFRTEGSRSAKKNLTVFVKATQVDARGMTRADRELARSVAAE